MRSRPIQILHFFSWILLLTACTGDYKNKESKIVIQIAADPQSMNPVTYTDNYTGTISKNIFQTMMDVDFKTLKFVPLLAESFPVTEIKPGGKIFVTNTIRKEAAWDNGSPITASDAVFSLKVIKNPKVNAINIGTIYENVEDVILYPDNPRKFTVVFDTLYFMATSIAGDFAILPEYVYDPKGLMRKFTLKQLHTEAEKLAEDKAIIEFADDFNSEKRMREKDFISGSGAYRFADWQTGQQLVLERKKNWWGDKLKGENCYFEAYPEKIVYKIINDNNTAVNSLKAGVIDAMYAIPPKDFVDLKKSASVRERFNLFTPLQLAYYYVGVNTKSPALSDKKTRQAVAHLTNTDYIINSILYGMAEKCSGPIHPFKKKEYNPDIKPYPFDPAKARALLVEAGWENTNGDKTLDKVIDGKRTEFVLNLVTNSGNEIRKQIAIMLKNEAEKVGIEINIQTQEWSVFIENSQQHKFDLMISGWVSTPVASDIRPQYHTESQRNGVNYSNFGTPESDMLLDKISLELDEEKRFPMFKRLQEIIHDETAMIFLYVPLDRIAISKKIINAEVSIMRPGFWEAGFKTAENK